MYIYIYYLNVSIYLYIYIHTGLSFRILWIIDGQGTTQMQQGGGSIQLLREFGRGSNFLGFKQIDLWQCDNALHVYIY